MEKLLTPWNIVIGVVATAIASFLIYLTVYWFRKKRRFRHFAIEHNLHTQRIHFIKNKDKTTKQITEIKYPTYQKSEQGIILKEFNYRVLVDEINTYLEQYERFFNCDLIEAKIDRNRNILLLKSQMPNEVFAEKSLHKSLKAKIGVDDQAKTHHLDFKNGVRVFITGPTSVGKSSLIETVLKELGEEADYYIIGPRKSFDYPKQNYYDSHSIEDLKLFLTDLESVKLQISEIKVKMRAEGIKDELFSDYVDQNQLDFKFKFFIFDDASTYLRSSFYSKSDEIKPTIEKISVEVNKLLREFRIYKTSVFVVAHSPLVDEVDISQNNYSHRFYNKVSNGNQSRSITGNDKTLMERRLGRGLWFVMSDHFNGYIRTVNKWQK